ncbi:hypothetical protein EV356DRAFT_502072 [Viridothelium virens]|uniref:Uncharacterized protein n=1 Tax=Viridothelium virens TaxID=1048519 RepID=A0A6A6HLV5_VIRVR|nr:hypothetical protein EV356DRAFT_502072 [Viridothelium virens]
MSSTRTGSVVSPTAPIHVAQHHVRECIERWEGHLEASRQPEAGFEQERHLPCVKSLDEMEGQQRVDAIHQLWFQSARERIFEIGKLQEENQSLKDQVARSAMLHQQIDELDEQMEEKDAEIFELLAEKQLVTEPEIEELESEIKSLKTQNDGLRIMATSRDRTIGDLSLENESLRWHLQQVCKIAGIVTDWCDGSRFHGLASDNANVVEVQTASEPPAPQVSTSKELKKATAAIEKLNVEKDEREHELQNTKRLLAISEDSLKNTRSELEIANHHLRLRQESVADMEAGRRKSSVTDVSLFEAEAYVRTTLEVERNMLELQLDEMLERQSKLEYNIEHLRFSLMDSIEGKAELKREMTNAKVLCRFLATERVNLKEALTNLRRCFESTIQGTQEKDAKIKELEVELERHSGMIVTLTGALTTARQQREQLQHELLSQTDQSRHCAELLQHERSEHECVERELQRRTTQLDRVRTNLVRAHVGRVQGFDPVRADKHFLERQLDGADKIIGTLEKQLDLTKKQLSGERELLGHYTTDVNDQIDGLEEETVTLQNKVKALDGDRNAVAGVALLGGALIDMLANLS